MISKLKLQKIRFRSMFIFSLLLLTQFSIAGSVNLPTYDPHLESFCSSEILRNVFVNIHQGIDSELLSNDFKAKLKSLELRFQSLTPAVSNKAPNRIWFIDWFAVNPKYRGNHLGLDLISIAEKRAKKLKIEWLNVYTSTSPDEAAANSLYEKVGYKITEKIPVQNADGTWVEDLYRQKHLDLSQ